MLLEGVWLLVVVRWSCSLLVARCLVFGVCFCCWFLVVCYWSPVVRCLLIVVCRLLFVVGCSLLVVRRFLFVVVCLLFVGCLLWCVDCFCLFLLFVDVCWFVGLLSVDSWSLFLDRCTLVFVSRMLVVICCLLFVACVR